MKRRKFIEGLGVALVSLNVLLLPDSFSSPTRVYSYLDVRIWLGDIEIKGFIDDGFITVNPGTKTRPFGNRHDRRRRMRRDTRRY